MFLFVVLPFKEIFYSFFKLAWYSKLLTLTIFHSKIVSKFTVFAIIFIFGKCNFFSHTVGIES